MREAAKRTLGMRHFDVQLVGGAVLHEGAIAEMKTGEGKTLVATLPLYLNALEGGGAHLVTVNDYLARRDAEWMRPVYEALGMTVGVIEAQMDPAARKAAYACDITYGTNSEFGFDYLRDNLAVDIEETVQRPHVFAIVDEVDSILVDEARTPLIIAGQPEESSDTYYTFAKIVKRFKLGEDYEVDEKRKTAAPTEQGVAKTEKALGIENLYAPGSSQMVNHLIQALRAESLYSNGVEYLVVDGEVKIVDEFTGRIMEGRRWSEGLHQAVEAKENVKIEAENVTVATVTIQNYFRLYEKLAGMTGTALTEANEFHEIYGLEVVPIPTNVPVTRLDQNDLIYKTEDEKFRAVVNDIAERHAEGQPVLVGTISVEVSERVSSLLERKGIPHNVLNAKTGQEGQEAQIIKDAGAKGAVTIATNMAGPRRRHQARRRRDRQGRPVRDRHRAPRVAPHRQPVARPLRPPGRSGRDALLPLGRGSARAPLRGRPHLHDPRQARPGRGPADRAQDADEAHRGRPEARRGDALRHAQAGAQVRRRAQQAARGDLRGAPRRARGRRPQRGDPRVDRRGRRGRRHGPHRVELPRGVGSRRASSPASTRSSRSRSTTRASGRSRSSTARS